MRQIDSGHSTFNEIKFIDKLGTYSGTDVLRRDLLIGYISGCKRRVNWGMINSNEVISHARKSLNKL